MNAYRIKAGAGIAALAQSPQESRALAHGEVRVRLHAAALNYRDLALAEGSFGSGDTLYIPGSDGAGDVVETGAGVTRFRTGDRVITSFYPDWIDGPATPAKTARALGGSLDGVLATEIVLKEDALARAPGHLDYHEAATLPCAGLTAWNALFVQGGAKIGDSVLLLGTGGVSIMALQLAKAAGLRTIITSSSDEKLARAKTLGAAAGVNYRSTPDWENEVLRHTEGRGVDVVLEVGGKETLPHSIAATRMGGLVNIIGGVAGFSTEMSLFPLIGGSRRLGGINVGSRSMLDDLVRATESAGIRPLVDRVYAFKDAGAAFADLKAGKHFGKLVVTVD